MFIIYKIIELYIFCILFIKKLLIIIFHQLAYLKSERNHKITIKRERETALYFLPSSNCATSIPSNQAHTPHTHKFSSKFIKINFKVHQSPPKRRLENMEQNINPDHPQSSNLSKHNDDSVMIKDNHAVSKR